MKGITGLYANMFQDLDIMTIQQAKKFTQDEYSYYGIRPEHHKWRYAIMALKHNAKADKITPKTETSHSMRPREKHRQTFIEELEAKIEAAPDGHYKDALKRTRALLEKQDKLSSGKA